MAFIVKKIEIKEPESSYPDVDSDFGTNLQTGMGRNDIIDYLINKYGKNYVAMVGNRLFYSGKSVLRDLGQVYDIPSSETQNASKEFNNDLSVDENIEYSQAVKEYFENYPELKDKVDRIVGTCSGLGVHAGGVVISDPVRNFDLRKWCALQRTQEDGSIATLWTKKEVEQIGLIKYDILGLSSASQIHYAKKMIGLDPYEDCEEDEEVFKHIIFNLKHKNIFQFETHLGRKAFEDLKPMSIMEVANASGLIRIVGSEAGRAIYNTYKENIDYAQQGEKDYWKETLLEQIIEKRNYTIAEKVLSESYGVLIYQEQLAYLVVGFSDGEKCFVDGNKVRKALDKLGEKGNIYSFQGNREALKKWHDEFMGIMNEYILPYIGKDGWDHPNKEVRDFLNFKLDAEDYLPIPTKGIISWFISAAAYLFSKLHAVAYSTNTYNMMWLKYYYPLEFWTASLICEQNDLEKVKSYITAIQTEEGDKIKILPPDVNKSNKEFTYIKYDDDEEEYGCIRYGLGAIMNLGKSADEIIRERDKNGLYKSIKDFINRVPSRTVNKRVIENLMLVGAFSEFGSLNKIYSNIIECGKDIDEPEYDEDTMALNEAKLLGVNISYIHPLLHSAQYYTAINEIESGSAQIAVRILNTYNKVTKKNKPYIMGRVQCLNCNEVINVFDWSNGQNFLMETGKMCILNVKKNGDFFQLVMDNRGDRWK